jgi:MFS transporter, DHA1 family, multidrug resistance protein
VVVSEDSHRLPSQLLTYSNISPVSEVYGRIPSVMVPYIFFFAFSLGSATAKDIQTLMITRFFAGMFASAPVSNVGGSLGDMWSQKERGVAVVFYSLAVVAGE